jgi:putative two-component system response regulator
MLSSSIRHWALDVERWTFSLPLNRGTFSFRVAAAGRKPKNASMPHGICLLEVNGRLPMTEDPIKSARILIVDDELAIVGLLEGILKDAGYKNLSETNDSRVALAMFTDYHPDLILLDLHMPHQDGYQILRTLRKLVPADAFLPIIVVTGDTAPEARRRALALGATDFIFKPFDVLAVALRVQNILRIRFLHRQLQNEKAALEKRVRERTRSLERMIAELRCAALPLFSGIQ